ncbi:Ribosomal RNA large subunit methyltransferase A [Alloactinosynnema sp. L-07]|uniref:putative RNA methyltransferase n=1 Tax=Alloactinosynnema sp. L-07 TaxID=1653480 RepID=UPI00065F01A7|nr:methyltransferase domain-containing protein [Alloactinosynnema sp. L-07]CRK61466.1 Ribosomal RNA large subunit methyltransferase A [Alloactinosynnema sp. L-07]
MLADVVSLLVCPHCGADLAESPGVLRCPRGHSFDVARQGYVSLLCGTATFTGDTADMVDARVRFLGAGHYAPITDVIAEAARPGPGAVIDVGAGTGHYLAAALTAFGDRVGIAVDVSKPALRRAARAHPLIGAIVCDAWQPLPVRDAAAGLTLSVFAPRNPAELHRVLHPEGTAVVVAPTARHLAELVSTLDLLAVEEDKQSRIDDRMASHFTVVDQRDQEFPMSLPHDMVSVLVGMGPNAFHAAGRGFARQIAGLPDPLTVTGSVTVSVYEPSGR